MTTEPPLGPATTSRVLLPFALATLIWGSTWLVVRDQLGIVPPIWSVCYRFALAGMVLLGYSRATGLPIALGARGQRLALLLGLSQFVGNYVFVYLAETSITSGLVAVTFALVIVPNAILGRIVLGQTLSRPFLAGAAVAILGIAFLFRHEYRAAGTHGDALLLGLGGMIVGTICASVASLIQELPAARGAPPASLLGWAMLWGAGGDALLAGILSGPPRFEVSLGYVFGLLYLVLFGSSLAFLLYNGVLRGIGLARAAYSSVLIPVIAMLLSTMFEHYRWTADAVLGAVLVAAGLVIALRGRAPVAGLSTTAQPATAQPAPVQPVSARSPSR